MYHQLTSTKYDCIRLLHIGGSLWQYIGNIGEHLRLSYSIRIAKLEAHPQKLQSLSKSLFSFLVQHHYGVVE